MSVGAISSSSSASNAVEVKVLNTQRDQLKAVVSTLLQGVAESAPRAAGQTGQRLNVSA
ncbi:MAG: hypothetical protein K1X83_02245 [Oligoflexia bacterium]|nr:hypothetical protein [Oligoflexia bacterium]